MARETGEILPMFDVVVVMRLHKQAVSNSWPWIQRCRGKQIPLTAYKENTHTIGINEVISPS